MTINIGYDTYKFWNCSERKIEVSSDTLKKLGLTFDFKFAFDSYETIINIIAKKHNMTSEEVYKNRSRTEGFN